MKRYQDILGDGGSNILAQVQDQQRRLQNNLSQVKKILAVASGKGGVGKSTLAAALAVHLARKGRPIGILDTDFHGSSIARMLGLSFRKLPAGREAADPILGPL